MDKFVGLFNCNKDLASEMMTKRNCVILNKDSDINNNMNGCYIDWISTSGIKTVDNAKRLLLQSFIIQYVVKNKIPSIVFDSTFSLTPEEVLFFDKYKNIQIGEPSIFPSYKTFFPLYQGIKHKELNDIDIDDEIRPIDVLYVGDLTNKIQAFEDNYIWLKKFWPKLNICYNSSDLIESKVKEYELESVTKTEESWDKAKFTIIIGSWRDYTFGRLSNNIFNCIRNACVPYIADEHRFYKSFSYLTRDISVALDFRYDLYYIGYIHDFHQRVKKYYPEMLVENVVSIIYNRLKV